MGSTPVNMSASRGAAFCGFSPYKSAVEAWAEFMEERKPGFCAANGFVAPAKKDPWATPYDPKLASLRWGLAFEDAICSYANVTKDRERVYDYASGGRPWITCHIDGREESGRLNENKTAFDMAFKQSWGPDGSDQIPRQYQWQGQHQMLCTGDTEERFNLLVFPKAPAEWEKMGYKVGILGNLFYNPFSKYTMNDTPIYSFFMSLVLLGYFHQYSIHANVTAQKAMVELYDHIWNENILKETPPPAAGYDDLKWLFAAPEGEIEANDEIRELWQEYSDCDNEIKSMTDRMGQIKDTFAQYADICRREQIIRKNGNEPGKLNIMAGNRKLFSVSRPKPGIAVSRSSVDRMKDDYPELYDDMKKTSLAEILDLSFTENQTEEIAELEKQEIKLLGKKKLSALLDKTSVMHGIEKNKPELYEKLKTCGMVEETEPVARLNVTKLKEEQEHD
jgi:hypothetical protein